MGRDLVKETATTLLEESSGDLTALQRDLKREVEAEVAFDASYRSAYSTDASNYRQVPLAVVVPKNVEAGAAAVRIALEHRVPVLSRGGGTSLAGQTTNRAVVIDWSKHCNSLVDVDPLGKSCVVEPGIVLDDLNRALTGHNLEFGPRPSTHSRCTLGGMLGNNSCGSTAQRTGKTVDNTRSLDVLLADGTRMTLGAADDERLAAIVRSGGREAQLHRQLKALQQEHLAALRTGYPQIPRRVSGYNLDSLLPEKGFHVARALVGSEGTLATILRAEVDLVPVVQYRTMLALGYPDIARAADDVPQVLESEPIALEGIDHLLIHNESIKRMHPDSLKLLPEGPAYLLVELGGASQSEADDRAKKLLSNLGRAGTDDTVGQYTDGREQREIWQARESGLGATARVTGEPDTWPGWEDAAVAPEKLGSYLREFSELLKAHDLEPAALYGHFGQGCVHTRIPFRLTTADGVANFRSFIEDAADLVTSMGGSLSGEHGDGQARGELLGKMFGTELVNAFKEMKSIFDPSNLLNPGKVVDPNPLDSNLRLGADLALANPTTSFGYPDDDGSFARAVSRCVGVGECRKTDSGVMCPSYMATRDERHSTRGRSRLLFEMLNGSAREGQITDRWQSEPVNEALDLCLACKACKNECPVNVDMATYKAEFLSHHFAGRIRPRTHYSMGWLPLWAAGASIAPRLINRLAGTKTVTKLARSVGGLDDHRDLPQFSDQSLQKWFRRRTKRPSGRRGQVVLWPDTFTNRFTAEAGRAAVRVLEDAGWSVSMPRQPVCCGLTSISTGQLGIAKRTLRRSLEVLQPHLEADQLVVGLEPSCLAVFRSDAHELLPDSDLAQRASKQFVTLSELLIEHSPGYEPPKMDVQTVRQVHCHQQAIMKDEADSVLLKAMGVQDDPLDSGCCGLAGNFGFEAGHYAVSNTLVERVLAPTLRDLDDGTVVLADGFSCRTQIEQSDCGGHHGIHLAQLIDQARTHRPAVGQ